MIRHASLFLTAATPVFPLVAVMIEPPFRALLVAFVGLPPLLPAGFVAACGAAIAVSAIAVRADVEHRAALPAETNPMKEDRFPVYRRHASLQAGLDNGAGFVAGWNQITLALPDEGCRIRNPAAPTAGFLLLHALLPRYFVRRDRYLMTGPMIAPHGADEVA